MRTLNNGADWGFIADVDSGRVHEWVACAAHTAMWTYVRPISSGGANMQMVITATDSGTSR